MNELDLIARLTRSLPANPSVVAGPGDDCAVLDCGAPGRFLLFKTDAVVARRPFYVRGQAGADRPQGAGTLFERHRRHGRNAPGRAGHGGVAANFEPRFIERIYAGINRLAATDGVAIAGGRNHHQPGRLLLSISMVGEVARDKCVLRGGAKAGDALW